MNMSKFIHENSKLQYDLQSDRLLNKAKILNQVEEIEWTQSMIYKLQKRIDEHQQAIIEYTSERNFLNEQKSYLQLLNFGDNYIETIELDVAEVVTPMKRDNDNTLSLFNDKYEILKSPKPKEFYQSIIDRLSLNSHCSELYFPNQTFIPNVLKVTTAARKMILYRIDTVGEYNLSGIICHPVTMAIDIHVARGSGELLSLRGVDPTAQYRSSALLSNMSYYILKSQTTATRFVILACKVPMLLALDVHSQELDVLCHTETLPVPVGFDFEYPGRRGQFQNSFLRRKLQLKEIRTHLVFMEAFFGENVYGRLVPLSLAVVDYDGVILLNTVMCPRTRIKDYNQYQHGLTETNVIGKQDSEEAMELFHKVMSDKIIVGLNLANKLRDLKIDMECLCGVRELQCCSALKELMPCDRITWNLNNIVGRILKQTLSTSFLSSEQVAQLLRRVYIAIESRWKESYWTSQRTNHYRDKLNQ